MTKAAKLGFIGIGFLFVATSVLADSPPWAPVHGKKAKQGEYNGGSQVQNRSSTTHTTVSETTHRTVTTVQGGTQSGNRTSMPAGPRAQQISRQYLYYPDTQVYFDAARKLYAYQANNQWVVTASLPQNLQSSLNRNKAVALNMHTDNPLQFHHEIAKAYPPSAQTARGAVQRNASVYSQPRPPGAAQAPGWSAQRQREMTTTYSQTISGNTVQQGGGGLQPSKTPMLPAMPIPIPRTGYSSGGLAQNTAIHQYKYFPDASVYFNRNKKLYHYFSNNRWHTGHTLPSAIKINPREFVSLDVAGDKPYLHHQEIAHRYPPGITKQMQHGSGYERDTKHKVKGKKHRHEAHYKGKSKHKHGKKGHKKHKEKHKHKHKDKHKHKEKKGRHK